MTETLWEDLIRTALVGTDRSRTPVRVRTWLTERDIHLPDEPGRALLQSVAAFRLMQRAAALPPILAEPLPAPATVEDAPSEARLSVGRLLQAPYRNALPEFVALCYQYGRQLPPESLPSLFEAARKDAGLRPALPHLAGERGKWLLRKNPEWAILRWDLRPDDWDHLDADGRTGLLRQLREKNPELARDTLVAAWPDCQWQEKVRYLQTFTTGLSAEDAAFLEMARTDGRQEVRRTAAELLLRCPGSQVSEDARMDAYRYVDWQRHGIAVALPEEGAPFLQEHRLPDSSQVKSMSLRESHLFFRLMVLPVSYWLDDRPAAQWLAGAEMADHGEVLFRAWWQANQRDKNPEWSRAWTDWLLQQGRLPEWVYTVDLEALTTGMEADTFNRLLHVAVVELEGLVREGSPAHRLLMAAPHIWNEELSRVVVDPFEEYIVGASSFYWDTWHYRDLLRQASFRLWPGLDEELAYRWRPGQIDWGPWQREIESLLRILHFRANFHREIGT